MIQEKYNIMKNKAINLVEKFSLIDKDWCPKIIGELNGQYVKVCRMRDDFVWHLHDNEDELFMVFKGTLFIEFRERETVKVSEGEIFIVPKGVEHRPRTEGEVVYNLLFEPKSTLHTGNLQTNRTVSKLDWI